jgi:hypothetical protein
MSLPAALLLVAAAHGALILRVGGVATHELQLSQGSFSLSELPRLPGAAIAADGGLLTAAVTSEGDRSDADALLIAPLSASLPAVRSTRGAAITRDVDTARTTQCAMAASGMRGFLLLHRLNTGHITSVELRARGDDESCAMREQQAPAALSQPLILALAQPKPAESAVLPNLIEALLPNPSGALSAKDAAAAEAKEEPGFLRKYVSVNAAPLQALTRAVVLHRASRPRHHVRRRRRRRRRTRALE